MGTPCNSEGIKNRHSRVLNSALYRCLGRLYFFLLYISGRYNVSSPRSSQIYEKNSIYLRQSMLHTLVFCFGRVLWSRNAINRLTPITFTCGRDCETPDIYGAVPLGLLKAVKGMGFFWWVIRSLTCLDTELRK